MLTINIPDYCKKEVIYILDLVMNRYWGIEYELQQSSDEWFHINTANGRVHMPGIFFKLYAENGISENILPARPLKKARFPEGQLSNVCMEGELPVIYGLGSSGANYVTREAADTYINIDIFGSAFFMLSRVEELVVKSRDRFDRFPASSSLAVQENFLHRPIINEYLEILWTILGEYIPAISRKENTFQMQPTHDIDRPFAVYDSSILSFIKVAISDVITRKRMSGLGTMLSGYVGTKRDGFKNDPYCTFDYIMEQSDKRNLKSIFYFIATKERSMQDCPHLITDDAVMKLLYEIHKQGHYIGLHASFDSYRDEARLRSEYEHLNQVLDKLGIHQETFMSRQHYLRWHYPDTSRNLDALQVTSDSTLAYAEKSGFRCGICFEFPVFDLIAGRQLDLVETPLIVMESSILSNMPPGKGLSEEGLEEFIRLKEACRKYSGKYTLLWHNSWLVYSEERRMYEAVLDA